MTFSTKLPSVTRSNLSKLKRSSRKIIGLRIKSSTQSSMKPIALAHAEAFIPNILRSNGCALCCRFQFLFSSSFIVQTMSSILNPSICSALECVALDLHLLDLRSWTSFRKLPSMIFIAQILTAESSVSELFEHCSALLAFVFWIVEWWAFEVRIVPPALLPLFTNVFCQALWRGWKNKIRR